MVLPGALYPECGLVHISREYGLLIYRIHFGLIYDLVLVPTYLGRRECFRCYLLGFFASADIPALLPFARVRDSFWMPLCADVSVVMNL